MTNKTQQHLNELAAELASILAVKLQTMYVILGDPGRCSIGANCGLTNALLNVSSGNIILEDYVFLGHNVTLITGTHDITKKGLERQQAIPKSGRDITIRKGGLDLQPCNRDRPL